MSIDLAVIGGSGLYQFEGLENTERHAVQTPFGPASGDVVTGDFRGRRLAFLARHGESHTVPPHRVNYRANLWALHAMGARRVVAVNAVGGIRDDMGPRTLVVPDQIIDYTHGRYTSFNDVEGSEVRHIDFSEPYSAALRQALLAAARAEGLAIIDGGCHGVTQGPRLETRAEIARMKRDGCDLVGMTGMPEAGLARELGLEYVCLAIVANWAAGCGDAQEITLAEVLANVEAASAGLPELIGELARG